MEPIVQAAVALGSLPPDYATRVMARLQPGDLQRLVSVFPDQQSISNLDRAAVLERLTKEIVAGRIRQEPTERIVESGPVTDHESKHDHGTKIEGNTCYSNHRSADAAESDCIAMADWRNLGTNELVDLLDSEHPYLVAQALALLAPHQIADVLKRFEPSLRLSIVKRLCEVDQISDASREYLAKMIREKRLARCAERLSNSGASSSTAPPSSSAMDRRQDLSNAETSDHVVASSDGKVLTFADLAKFSKTDMQKLLKTADTSLWAPALFRSDRSVINNVILSMAPRPAALLLQEISEQTQVSPTAQEAARSRLLELCRTLCLPTPASYGNHRNHPTAS